MLAKKFLLALNISIVCVCPVILLLNAADSIPVLNALSQGHTF